MRRSRKILQQRTMFNNNSRAPIVLAFLIVCFLSCSLNDRHDYRSRSVFVSATKESANEFRTPKSQVILRVENYRYERRGRLSNNHYNNIGANEELKMVLLQEVHAETSTSTTSDGDDGDGNSTDITDNYNNATITTTSISYANPIRRLWNNWWTTLDEMDKMIVTSTLPLAALTSIIPLVAGADLFWINQLGNALAVSAQSASNVVYQFSFGLFSFLPSVTATLVSKYYANDNINETQNVICQSLLFAVTISTIATTILFINPTRFLNAILKDGNPALALAVPYLRIRSLSLLPQTAAFVGFSAFRGTMDLKSCVKISVITNSLNMILTPILVHLFRFGLNGSAISALVCDCITAIMYLNLMLDRKFLIWKKLMKLPSWKQIAPLVKGSTLQARSFAMHITNIMVARKVQSIDDTGVAPAAFALAMQTFTLGGVIIFAMGMATQTLYPNAVANCPEEYKGEFQKALMQRLLNRGFGVGAIVSLIQLILAPGILRSTPLQAVRQAAIFPMMIVIAFQGVIGLASVGEGIIIGNGKFALASSILVCASLGYMGFLRLVPESMGINGVFLCLAAFALFRLVGVLISLPSIVNEGSNEPLQSNATAA